MTEPLTTDWPAVRAAIAAAMQGRTQADVAGAAGVDRTALTKFLNGSRAALDLDTLRRVAPVLGLDAGALLGLGGGASGDAPAGFILAEHSDISPALLNPRKSFDDAKTDGLADSIAATGLSTPLIITRSTSDKGKPWLLVDGERRWRAIQKLITEGSWSGPVPCCVLEAGDAQQHLILALTTSIQREDLAPLEEAEAFRKLQMDHGMSTAAIAATIGKTQRHVQLRLELVEKLSPKVQKALAAGEISLASARALTPAAPAQQDSALKEIKGGNWRYNTAESIREAVMESLVPISYAKFDTAALANTLVTVDDVVYSNDFALFAQLQREAVAARAKALKAEGYNFVKIVDRTKNEWFESWQWSKDKRRPKGKQGVVLAIDRDLEAEEEFGLYKPEQRDIEEVTGKGAGKAPAKPASKPSAAITQAHMVACRQTKTRALQNEIAEAPVAIAMRAVVLALMAGGNCEVRLRHTADQTSSGRNDHVTAASLDLLAERYAGPFKHLAGRSGYKAHPLDIESHDRDKHAKAWEIVCGLPDADVAKMFSLLVARAVGSWNGYRSALGDDPLARAMAATLEIDMAEYIELDAKFLATCRKGQLEQISRAIAPDHDLKGIKTQALIELVAAEAKDGGHGTYVPPSLRFGTPEEIARLIDDDATEGGS